MMRRPAAYKAPEPAETDEPLFRKPSAPSTPSNASLTLVRTEADRLTQQASLEFWSRMLAEAQESPEDDDDALADESSEAPASGGLAPAADLRMIVFGTNWPTPAGAQGPDADRTSGDGGFVVFGPGENLFLKKPAPSAMRSAALPAPLKLARSAGESHPPEVKSPEAPAARAASAEPRCEPERPARLYWAGFGSLVLLLWLCSSVGPTSVWHAGKVVTERHPIALSTGDLLAPAAPALVALGDEYLRTGDIIAARLCYERAAAAGSARAALMMGKTFDPAFLASVGIPGLRGETETALEWYRRAWALDDPGAARPVRPE